MDKLCDACVHRLPDFRCGRRGDYQPRYWHERIDANGYGREGAYFIRKSIGKRLIEWLRGDK